MVPSSLNEPCTLELPTPLRPYTGNGDSGKWGMIPVSGARFRSNRKSAPLPTGILPHIKRNPAPLPLDSMPHFDRNPHAKHFVSYTGLAPSPYASSSRLVHGPLTKQGNRWLRWAFIEAVTPAVRSSPLLCDHYTKVKSRRGAKDARCSTARKIAELAYTVWSEQRCWEETRS